MGKDKKRYVMEEAASIAQGYTDKILGALNPTKCRDLPFIAFSLHSVLKLIEHKMDSKQLALYEGMKMFIRSEGGTRKHDKQEHTGDAEDNSFGAPDGFRRKNTKGGGMKNEVQGLPVLWRTLRSGRKMRLSEEGGRG